MGQVFKKYWTTVSKKPKGFKSLGSNIYEYKVWFRIRKEYSVEYDIYKEIIPTHYEYIGNHGERKIDILKFIKSVKKITGVNISKEGGYIHKELFRRDGILVPFVEYVYIPNDKKELYLEFRDMRYRVLKINQIKNKIRC